MGRPRKKPSEWTTEEAMKKLFPSRVTKRLKKAADEAAPKPSEKPIPKDKS
jgi:hypothetical protein